MKLYKFAITALLFSYQVFPQSFLFPPKAKGIFEAIETNDIKIFKEYLAQVGAKQDVRDKDGRTPLHMASIRGLKEFCKILLEDNEWFEFRDKEGNTAFHLVCWNGQYPIGQLFLECGVDIESPDAEGNTALHLASGKGNLLLCTLLLDKGANLEAQNKEGRTPLHIACVMVEEYTCSLLLGRKAKGMAQDKKGNTALHIAATQGDELLCKSLLGYCDTKDVKNTEGHTPLWVACAIGNTAVCKLLLESGSKIKDCDIEGNTFLHLAVQRGDELICTLFLDMGADKEAQNNDGNTPLHVACTTGNITACKFLLKRGANVNSLAKSAVTPLMVACKEGHIDVVTLLLADNTLRKEHKDTNWGGTALHWACHYNQLEICKKLLAAEFNPNSKAKSFSLLHIAVEKEYLELVNLFLRQQLDRNISDKNGATPLHLSCQLGRDLITEKFLDNKDLYRININAITLSGKTPLHYAVENNQPSSVQLLLDSHALPNEKDIYGKTPIMYAAEKKQLKICELLKERISVTDFNRARSFLSSLVRGHKELEELFGVYSELSILPNSGSVSREGTQGVRGLMSRQSLPDSGVSSSPAYVSEQNFSEDKANDDSIDQVSDDEDSQ